MSLTGLTLRLVRRTMLIWTAVVAFIIVTGVYAYTSAYPTAKSRADLTSGLGSSVGLDALYGKAVHIDTVGGFLAWRYGMIAALILAMWAMFSVTRVTRGDEDAGRADVLLLGTVSPRGLLARQLAAIAITVLVVAAGAFIACIAMGLPASGSAWFTLVTVSGAFMFGSLAALVSQLVGTRRTASTITGSLLGASFLIRAIADATPTRDSLIWLSPLGWSEQLVPFEPSRPLGAVALIAAFTAVCTTGAIWLRGARDNGGGIFSRRARDRRARRLHTPFRLGLVLARGMVIGWTIGMLVMGLVFGFIASDLIDFLKQDPRTAEMASKFGNGVDLITIRGFIGLSYAEIAMFLAIFAGIMIIGARTQEADHHVSQLTTAGVSRTRWLAVTTVIMAVSTVVVAVASAVGVWAGVELTHHTISMGDCLAAALNVVPISIMCGAITLAGFAVWPRVTPFFAYGIATVAYLIQILSAISGAPSWLGDLSPFTHVAAVPAVDTNVAAQLVMLLVALAAIVLAIVAFNRRDLVDE